MSRWLASLSPAGIRRLLRWLGTVLLVAGLGIAASIWSSQDRRERQARPHRGKTVHEVTILDPLAAEDSNRYAQNVELYYGKSGLLMDKTMRWLESLGQGKPLAWTVATVSVVLGGGIFLLAALYRPDRLRPQT